MSFVKEHFTIRFDQYISNTHQQMLILQPQGIEPVCRMERLKWLKKYFFPCKYFTVKDPLQKKKKGSISVFTKDPGLISHQSYSLHPDNLLWCMIPLYLTQSVNTYFTYVLQWNNHIPQTVEIKTGRNTTLCTVWQNGVTGNGVEFYLLQNKTVFRNRFASTLCLDDRHVNWKLCCQSSHLWKYRFWIHIHQTEPDLCLFQTT